MSLTYDPDRAVEHLRQTDAVMKRLIEEAGPFRLEVRSNRSVFDVLLRSIVYQQLSDRAASTILGRVHDLMRDDGEPRPERLLALDPEALRKAGMSYAKIRAARDLAEKTMADALPGLDALKKMGDDAIVDALTKVWGIGPWTVHMLLIFHLGRPDVLPVTDLGVKKGFMFVYGMEELPSPDTLTEQGAIWSPYRSVASWYLWRAVDLREGTAPPAM